MTNKFCSSCATFKPLTDFHNNAQSVDGKAHKCTVCANSYQRIRYGRIRQMIKRDAENQDYELASPAAVRQPGEMKDDELVSQIKANIAELAKRWNRARLDTFRIYLAEEVMRYISDPKPRL
jgi:hypothetical protein